MKQYQLNTSSPDVQSAGRLASERGAAMMEAAVILPLLFVIIFGIIQYGLIFASYVSLRTAGYSVARYEVLLDKTGQAALTTDQVARASLGPLLSPDNLQPVGDPAASVENGVPVTTIRLDYDLPLFFPLVVPSENNGQLRLTAVTIFAG